MAFDVAAYWERRYARGAGSGAGSRGEWAQRKADYVNELIRRENIQSVIDWGCGDGYQLALLNLPYWYMGIDVSPTVLNKCRALFPDREFRLYPQTGLRGQLALSMDVVFHLPDDGEFWRYIHRVFTSATQFVLVHGTDHDHVGSPHYRSRAWVTEALERYPEFRLVDRYLLDAEMGMGFFLFEKD